MEVKTIWTEETVVKSFETDFQLKWKPACLFQSMQEAGSHHAAHLGYSYEAMIANGKAWILSRAKVRFYSFPRMDERVLIKTWPKGIQQKLFFMRDFQFTSPGGQLYAAASSAFILIDPQARRMLLPQTLSGRLPDNNGLSAIDEPLEKISSPDELPERLQIQAGYSAVDMMGHVNNARYIEWISDSFSLDEHAAQELDWLQINYVNEVRPGETVSIAGGPGGEPGSPWFVQGTNLATSARAFEAALGWKQPQAI